MAERHKDRARFYEVPVTLPSVTTFLGSTWDKSEWLTPWAVNEHRKALSRLLGSAENTAALDIDAINVINNSDPAVAITMASAEFGSRVHRRVHCWALDIMGHKTRPSFCSAFGPDTDAAFESWLRWADRVKFQPVATELLVFCAVCGFAGTLDLYGEILAPHELGLKWTNDDVPRAVLDLKSGNRISPEHHLQVRAYRHAAAQSHSHQSDIGIVVRLPKETGKEAEAVVSPEISFSVIRASLQAWRWYRAAEGKPVGTVPGGPHAD